MAFSAIQLRLLREHLKPEAVKSRERSGRIFQYIEGWHAISEANRIFGYDAWNRETLETKCLQSRESQGAFQAVYLAKVRISVRVKDQIVVRDGFGTGEAQERFVSRV